MTERTASIDDLLGSDELIRLREEPEEPPGRRRRIGPWIWPVLIAAGFTAVTVVGLRMFALGISVPAVFAAWLALLLLRRATARVKAPAHRTVQPMRSSAADDGMYNFGALDGLRGVVDRWENKLVWSHAEPGRYAKGVHPSLGELVDERLRQRHGVTRASDPARARALLGEQVWKFLDSPPKRTPPPRDLAVIVAQLEKL
ncbi:hypothetical protein [Micromonospora sp. NBC_01796]|uniref:hypothetical protein n=1 Tax=Micromonospora sp. NBC_01796 TaxID=2975987 RepID=UPI002DD7D87B|nr:hypothetical protein [Micromonospora sp. NBC_01796]WSA87619.1 hypothetical protein OIE47_08420 [Micromonospora sp. NBC_01796]